MNKMQDKLLEIFKWLVQYLNDNCLRYYVICGTMLGAVRHKGFIPWDDDIDIAMPRADYEILLCNFKNPIGNYYLESPKSFSKDYPCGYAKLYDMNTTLIEDIKKPLVRGIFIDIFPLDGIGNEYEISKRNYRRIDRLNMLLAMRVSKIRKDRKWWKNIATVVGSFLPFSVKKLTIKLDFYCSKICYDESKYVGNLMSTYRSKEIMERSIFGKPTLYDFEDLKVCGPEKYDEYLKTLFGDWHKLPPVEKRKTAHDFIYIDFEKPYILYDEK